MSDESTGKFVKSIYVCYFIKTGVWGNFTGL